MTATFTERELELIRLAVKKTADDSIAIGDGGAREWLDLFAKVAQIKLRAAREAAEGRT